MPGLLRARRRLRPRRRAHERAELDGDHFVVNGQKVWSSFAHIADWCILVTRSDPDVASSTRGLTYLLVDMHSPGVEVRPLRQITGEAEFNEIFFTDVEVPVENVLGEVGERLAGRDDDAAARARHARLRARRRRSSAQRAQARRRSRSERGVDDPVCATASRSEWIELQALRLTNYRALTTLMKTGMPGPGGLGREAHWSEQNQRLTKLALEILGPDAQLWTATARLLAATSSCAAAATRSRPARRRSCATSSPSACSASRGAVVDFAFSDEQEQLAQARGARSLPRAR